MQNLLCLTTYFSHCSSLLISQLWFHHLLPTMLASNIPNLTLFLSIPTFLMSVKVYCLCAVFSWVHVCFTQLTVCSWLGELKNKDNRFSCCEAPLLMTTRIMFHFQSFTFPAFSLPILFSVNKNEKLPQNYRADITKMMSDVGFLCNRELKWPHK